MSKDKEKINDTNIFSKELIGIIESKQEKNIISNIIKK